MADIFISYARADTPLANRLAQALEAHGLSVWIDQKIEGGSQFSEVIEREIEAATKVVVLWSPASVKSEWVRDEASLAKEQGKLVPIAIDGTPPPMGFRQTQTTRADDWASGRSQDLPAGMLAALSLEAREDEAPQPAPVAIKVNKRNFVFAAIAAAMLALAGVLYFTLDNNNEAGALADGERIAVVVRPFAASPGAPPQEMALAQGITDELVIRLRSIPELRIATADGQGNVPGEAFAGSYLVEGNIRQQGAQLRATASLKSSDGEVLWSDSFERPMKDIFYVQEDLATALAGVLSVSLEVGEDAAGYDGTTNPAAFAAFTQGLASQPLGDWERTIGYFERALELDPDYGRATAQLGTALAVRLVGSPLRDQAEADALVAQITDLADRSLEQHPESFLSQTNGIQMALARKDYVGAAKYGVRAKEIGFPDHISVITQYGLYPMALGLSEDIKDLQSRTALIEPNMRNIPFFIWPPILYRDYDEVIERFERAVRQGQQPGPFASHVVLAFWLKGDRDTAMEIARQYYPPMAQRLQAAAAGSPQASMTMPELREWLSGQMGVGGQEMAMDYAVAEAAYGHDEAAMRLIGLAMERPGGNMTFMLWHPIFDDVRKMPEFVDLIEELGIVDAWRETGEWGNWCRPVGDDGVTCS